MAYLNKTGLARVISKLLERIAQPFDALDARMEKVEGDYLSKSAGGTVVHDMYMGGWEEVNGSMQPMAGYENKNSLRVNGTMQCGDINVSGKVTAGNGEFDDMDLYGDLDMQGNNINNVQSITVKGTVRGDTYKAPKLDANGTSGTRVGKSTEPYADIYGTNIHGTLDGKATSADKLNTDAGATNKPVYFSGGKPVVCSYEINKTVPANAVFTDTKYTLPTATDTVLGGVKVDTALNANSTNPVQNKVINSALSGKAASSHKHGKSDITDFPSIPSVYNPTITIKQAGAVKGSFSLNQSGAATIDLTDNNTTYNVATQSNNGLLSSTDKKTIDTLGSTYLKLSGGTMTGNISFGTNGSIVKAGNNELQITGASKINLDSDTYMSNNNNFTMNGGRLTLAQEGGGMPSWIGVNKANSNYDGYVQFNLSEGIIFDNYVIAQSGMTVEGTLYTASGTVQKSDRNVKTDIEALEFEKAWGLINGLKPSTYKMVEGTSGRTHWGLISQEVEDAMTASGLTDMDFAGFVRAEKKDGSVEYCLRYDEFVAPLIRCVQDLQIRLEAAENELKAMSAKEAG